MEQINIITAHFYPENTAQTHRMVSVAKVLSNRYKVNVISLTEKGKYRSSKCSIFYKKIKIVYINQKNYNGRNFFIRASYEFFYSFKLSIISKKIKSDFIIVASPYMFLIQMVIIFSGRTRKLLDLGDLVWVYLEDSSFFKKIIKSFLTLIAKRYIEKYNYVIVTNNTEKKWLLENTTQRNIEVISNGVSRKQFDALSNITGSPCSDNFVISYIGNVGLAQNLLTFVKLAKFLNFFTVNIIGDGNDIKNLKSYVKINNITNVNFTGKLDFNKVKEYYKNSHILYAQLNEKFYSALPSKLFEYLSTGLPIVYNGKGEAVDFLKKYENVYITYPNGETELKDIIKKLSTKEIKISFNNRKLIEKNFIREKINLKYFEILKNKV